MSLSPSITDLFTGIKALVIGDVMLDREIVGRVHRISPEAPVPVVSIQQQRLCPGGAGNVAASLAALGCHVTLSGCVGTDRDGDLLQHTLRQANVAKLMLTASADLHTICKTRVLAGGQHLLRLDQDGCLADIERYGETLRSDVLPQIDQHQVVVLSDYEKGTLSEGLIRDVIERCRSAKIPCIVDPKKADLRVYRGATILCPNLREAERGLEFSLTGDDEIGAAARQLRSDLSLDFMLITRGADGMTLANEKGVVHIPARRCGARDVTGAGDTVVAVLAACLARSWEIDASCRLAALAASLAVSRSGTYVVSAGELQIAYEGNSPKILDWQAAKTFLEGPRRHGQRVVFTNGCFDILHAGHLYCLEQARQRGDLLVVGLNSDQSVRMLKGESRPIIDQEHRAALLAGLTCVDIVVLFHEETPADLIEYLRPDILVKGGEYAPATIPGADSVIRNGGQVITISMLPGLSTTRIVNAGKDGKTLRETEIAGDGRFPGPAAPSRP
jgi:D-beta-D-heptose 7-phosphate kinase/D-beta-D-heptose 1-phosphate adenosyltransferase